MGVEQYKVLHHKVLTGLVQAFKPPTLKGKAFFPTNAILSNQAEWDVERSARTLAEFSVVGTSAKTVALTSVEKKTSTLAHIFQKKIIPGAVMAFLREPGTEHQQMGEKKVSKELEQLDIVIENLKEWARWQVLTTGALVINQPDLKVSVDFQMASTHKPTAGTAWSNPAADILSNLRAWKKVVSEDCGEVVTKMIVSEDVMGYMLANTGIKAFMGEQLKTQLLESGYITRLLGMDIEVYDATYKDASGTIQRYLPSNKILMIAGSDFAEEQSGPSTDPKSGFRPGKFSKSWEQEDPPQVMVSVEENVLPVLKKPDNILCASVA